MGPKDRRKQRKNDTSSDIAVSLKPDRKICCVMQKGQKPDISQGKPLLVGVVDEQILITHVGTCTTLLN